VPLGAGRPKLRLATAVALTTTLLGSPSAWAARTRTGSSAGASSLSEAPATTSTLQISFELNPPGPNHIYIANPDGTNQVLLVKGRDPAWSPDGTRLTYRTGNPQRGGGIPTKIHVINADGTHIHTFEPNVYGEASGEAGSIVWSPDGRWLAFDSLGGIYVMHPNGKGLKLVSRYPGTLACYDLEPSWRPNGKRLVFAVLFDGGELGLWTVGFDGSRRQQLLSTNGPLLGAAEPAWSPNGRRIVFDGVRKKRHHGYAYDLYTIHPDGTGLTRITSGRSYPYAPAWAPHERISFSVDGRGIVVMRRDGTEMTQLDLGSTDACCLAWG